MMNVLIAMMYFKNGRRDKLISKTKRQFYSKWLIELSRYVDLLS